VGCHEKESEEFMSGVVPVNQQTIVNLSKGLEKIEGVVLKQFETTSSDKVIEICSKKIDMLIRIKGSLALIALGHDCNLPSIATLGAALQAYFAGAFDDDPARHAQLSQELLEALQQLVKESKAVSEAAIVAANRKNERGLLHRAFNWLLW
jgi:hypothetical protein